MKTISIKIILMAGLFGGLQAQSYNWPCQPFEEPHWINGTFCENRPSGSVQRHHFHDGVDIHLPQGDNVYSVINGSVTSIGTAASYGINAFVRVGRYAYVHVDAHPGLDVGESVTKLQTIIGATNSWNHIHFKDGYSGSERNALRQGGGLSPFDDPYDPSVEWIRFYENTTKTRFTDNKVTGLVEIVAKASDRTDTGPIGDNNGVLAISFQIFDSTGTVALTNKVERFRFDYIPASDAYITNVFFEGSTISDYLYTVTNRVSGDGYWDTRDYEPGTYVIKVETEDTHGNTDTRSASVRVVPQDRWAPETPQLLALEGDNQKNWSLNWFANDCTDVDHYNLYFTYWGDSWNENTSISESIAREDTTLTYSGFSNDLSIYFRLVAADDAAPSNTSDSSDAYGVRLSADGAEALIVDGFDRTDGYWQKQTHTFAIDYGVALTRAGVSFNTISDDALRMGQDVLTNYPRVIWFVGDDEGEEKSLNAQDREAIEQYLDNGGWLLLCGTNLGSDLALGSMEESTWYGTVLNAAFTEDSVLADDASGVAGSILDGFNASFKDGIHFEAISSVNGQTLMTYNNGLPAATYCGPEHGRNGSLLYLGFPLEALHEQDDRDALMAGLLQYGTANSIGNNKPVTERGFQLLNNYPNPFNPVTQIPFTLGKQSRVTLQIFDIRGSLIRTLVDGSLSGGAHSVTWDGRDRAGRKVGSGSYIYRLQSGEYSQSRMMVILK